MSDPIPDSRLPAPSRRVLVVEDDLTSRDYFRYALAKGGYTVVAADGVDAAQKQLAAAGSDVFDCVVTDYRMPDRSGLELLTWLKEEHPCLATIIVTAEGEKGLVTESLRGGAVDFLDKPVDLKKLLAAVAQAAERTQRQRHMADSETAVKELGRAQEWMLGVAGRSSPVCVELCFHPKLEAGGDFFSRFQPAPDRYFCLLTDVSGHDLHAAYISAYFQGIVRGMLQRGAPLPEVFTEFNRFLLEEWNQADMFRRRSAAVNASVAACALAFDFTSQTATVLTHGTPAPVHCLPDGSSRVVGEGGGFPLGWFSSFSPRATVHSVAPGGSLSLWTDGLADLAERNGVSALSLACALRRIQGQREKPAMIDSATDDILLADIYLSRDNPGAEVFHPLLLEQVAGVKAGAIDEFQSGWRRSLALAVPELPEERLHDVLLASREILLNALVHGCCGRADQSATFQAACCPGRRTLRVRVDDPGPGHNFALAEHAERAKRELVENRRGLILVRQLASAVSFERNGACVTLDFTF